MSVIKNRLTHADRIFNFLKKQKKPLTAYEILELMRVEGINAVTTVYRGLDKLNKKGLFGNLRINFSQPLTTVL